MNSVSYYDDVCGRNLIESR